MRERMPTPVRRRHWHRPPTLIFVTDKTLIARARTRAATAIRGGWAVWAPWMAALIVFILVVTTAPEVYDVESVEGGLLPLVAASVAVPVGLARTRPMVGWLIASVAAVIWWQTFPILDGDPWRMTVMHGLVILGLLLVLVWAPWPDALWLAHPAVGVVVWLATVGVVAMMTASDIRVGWSVGVTAVAAVGVVLRALGIRPRTATAVADADLADWKDGFREAFTGLPASRPTGGPFGARLFGNPEWLKWGRSIGPSVLAIAVFAIALADIDDTFQIHSLVLPIAAALLAFPVALIGNRVLLGWRIITILGIVFAVVGTPERAGYTWPAALEFVWLGLTFLVSTRHSRPTTVWVWLATVLAMSAGYANVTDGVESRTTSLIFGMTVLVFIGDLVRSRRSAAQSLEAQTELSELEKARRAVLEEKARIARDLHDVVAHHMSMVAVQAESAPYRLADLDDATRAEFASISKSARAALGEIRGFLGVLRNDFDGSADVRHAPQPGMNDIPALVDGSRRSGIAVTFQDSGDSADVTDIVGLSVYRIIQESLANAARHSPGSEVTVRVAVYDDVVDVRVTNSPPLDPVQPGKPGHGIVGMRERAAVVGGTLQAGPLPDGGFEVVGSMPTTPEEAA